MYSKIIFVLATVCVVNASMLTVNDDVDAESEVKVSPSRCNFKACDWQCRSRNKTSGTCVNGCNFRACQQQCRRLGYPRGACVKGVCKCDYLLNTKDAVAGPKVEQDSVQSRACNNNRCNQICRKQKFRGDACVGANCYCNKFLSLQDDTLTDSVENISRLSCNSIACDDQCRTTGWHSGVCINGQCKCDYFLNTEEMPIEAVPSACNTVSCNQWCHRLKYARGWCRFGQCQCY